MAQTFNLPSIGDAMVEGEVVEWFVAVGASVDLDQTICSIETDKSVVELTSPFRGTVLALGAEAGDVVAVGAPLLVVGEAGESAGTAAPTSAPAMPPPTIATSETIETSDPSERHPVNSPVVRRLASERGIDLSKVVGTGVGGRITRQDVESVVATPSTNGAIRAMPKIRKLARERGIDLAAVDGSGPHGAIIEADLGQSGRDGNHDRAYRRERLSAMRRSIAAHLTESATTIPQFTSTVDVDATALLATRDALRERLDIPVPIDAVLMTLLIPVLQDHPRMNAHLDGDEIVYHGRFDIGVAVDTPDGLVVPVVADADQRATAHIAEEIVRLATAARERTIQPHELAGSTCTINNVGAVGIETGTPILPLGTSTILAFGKARPMLRLNAGNPVEVPIITVCATFDHRLVDGGDAGRFLTQLRRHLEVPALGLL